MLFAFVPYNIQGDIGVVKFSIHAVVVQWDDVVQLGHRYVYISVVIGVQGDSAHTDAVGEEQVRLWGVVTWPAVSFEQDAGGTGAGRTVGTRQAQMGAAPVPPATLIKTWRGQRQKDWCKETDDRYANTDTLPHTNVCTRSRFLFTDCCCCFYTYHFNYLWTTHNTINRSYIQANKDNKQI